MHIFQRIHHHRFRAYTLCHGRQGPFFYKILQNRGFIPGVPAWEFAVLNGFFHHFPGGIRIFGKEFSRLFFFRCRNFLRHRIADVFQTFRAITDFLCFCNFFRRMIFAFFRERGRAEKGKKQRCCHKSNECQQNTCGKFPFGCRAYDFLLHILPAVYCAFCTLYHFLWKCKLFQGKIHRKKPYAGRIPGIRFCRDETQGISAVCGDVPG